MNNLMMAQPQVQPGGASQSQPVAPSPADIAAARAHAKVVMASLMGLAAKPKGTLSKEDLFGAAADMIAGGAFPTPEAKQALVAQLAQVPDDETAVRQLLGQKLMGLAQAHDLIHQHYGPGEP